MGNGISIHVALNHVDPAPYEGWDGALNACVADATDMRALAKKCGFKDNMMLLTKPPPRTRSARRLAPRRNR